MAYYDELLSGRLADRLDSASRLRTDFLGNPIPAGGSSAERVAEAVRRSVEGPAPSRLAVQQLVHELQTTRDAINRHAQSRPTQDTIFQSTEEGFVPPDVAQWEAVNAKLQSDLALVEKQLRDVYRQVANADPRASALGSDMASMAAALGERIPTRADGGTVRWVRGVGHSGPETLLEAARRIRAEKSLAPQTVSARQAKELEDAIRNAATVRMSNDPSRGSFAVSPFEIMQDPSVRGLIDGPDGQSRLNSLAAKLGVSGRNIEVEVIDALRKEALGRAAEGAANAGSRPLGEFGDSGLRTRNYEHATPGEETPRTMLEDTQIPLEEFVPVEASLPTRATRTLAIDPATGKPKLDGDGNPLPSVADDRFPGRGTPNWLQMMAGAYRPLGMQYDAPRGVFAGRMVNGQVEPDFDKPLIPLVKSRTGGDGNRSPESIVYLLPHGDGRVQILANDPTTGLPTPAALIDNRGIDRLMLWGYEPPASLKAAFRTSVSGQDPEAVGRMVFEVSRAASGQAGATPEAIRAALDNVRKWRMVGTQEDLDALHAAAGLGAPGAGQQRVADLEQRLADAELAEMRDVPASSTERAALEREQEALEQAARVRAAAAMAPQTIDVGLVSSADSSDVGARISPRGGGPKTRAARASQSVQDVSAGVAGESIDVMSPRYTSVFDSTRMAGGTVVDDSVIPGAAIDASVQSTASPAGLSPLDELLSGRASLSPVSTMDFTVTPNSWAASALSGADEPAAARLARASQLNNPFVPISDIVSSGDVSAGSSLNFAEQGLPTRGIGTTDIKADAVRTARRMKTSALEKRLRYLLGRREKLDPTTPNGRVAYDDLTRDIDGVYEELRGRINARGDVRDQRSIDRQMASASRKAGNDVPADYDPALALSASMDAEDADATADMLRGLSEEPADSRRLPLDTLRSLWKEWTGHPSSKRSGRPLVQRPRGFGDFDTRIGGGGVTEGSVENLQARISEADAEIRDTSAELEEQKRLLKAAGPDDRGEIQDEIDRLTGELERLDAEKDAVTRRFTGESDYEFDTAGENQARLIDTLLNAKSDVDRLSALRDLFSTNYSDPARTFEGIREAARSRGMPEPTDQQIIHSALSGNSSVRKQHTADYLWSESGRAAETLRRLQPPSARPAPPSYGPAFEGTYGPPKPESVGVLRRLMGMLTPQDSPSRAPVEPARPLDALYGEIPSAEALSGVTGYTYTKSLDGGVNAEAASRLRAMEDRMRAIDKEIDAGLAEIEGETPRAYMQRQKLARSNIGPKGSPLANERDALQRQYQAELDEFRRSVAKGAVSRIAEVEKKIPSTLDPAGPQPAQYSGGVRSRLEEAREAARRILSPSGVSSEPAFMTDAERAVEDLRKQMRNVDPASQKMSDLQAAYDEAVQNLPYDSPAAQRYREVMAPARTPDESRPAQDYETGGALTVARPKEEILREMRPIVEERARIEADRKQRLVGRNESAFDQREQSAELVRRLRKLKEELEAGGHSYTQEELMSVKPQPPAQDPTARKPLDVSLHDVVLPEDVARSLAADHASPRNSGKTTFAAYENADGSAQISMYRDGRLVGVYSGKKVAPGERFPELEGSGNRYVRLSPDGNVTVSGEPFPARSAPEPENFERFISDAENEAILEAARERRRVLSSPRENVGDKGSVQRPVGDGAGVEPESPAAVPAARGQDPAPVERDISSPASYGRDGVDLSEISGDPNSRVAAEAAPPARQSPAGTDAAKSPQGQRSSLGRFAGKTAIVTGAGVAGMYGLDRAGLLPSPSDVAGAMAPLVIGGMVAGPVGGYGGESAGAEDTNPEEIAARVRQARTPYFIAGNILPR